MKYYRGQPGSGNYWGQPGTIRCADCGTICANAETVRGHPCTPTVMADRKRRRGSMANIVLCDRCGQIATEKVAGSLAYWANPTADPVNAGLCPECSRELYRWLNDTGNQVRAIMAPFNPDDEPATVVNQAETSRAAIDAEFTD